MPVQEMKLAEMRMQDWFWEGLGEFVERSGASADHEAWETPKTNSHEEST
jgi:hypothetical protein